MNKITGDCPHCQKEIQLDQEKLDFVKQEAEKNQLQNVSATTTQILEQKPEVVEKIVEKIKTVRPHIQPSYKCKDGRCGKMHPNEAYTEAPSAKCTRCGQFTDSKTEICETCGNNEFDEVTQEDREDMGIPEPKEFQHNHDDTEDDE